MRFEANGGERWTILSQSLFTVLRKGVLAFLCLALRHPLGALDGGAVGNCFGNLWILGGSPSKEILIILGKLL